MTEHRPMPRLIVIRHGETEWSLNGRHTGRSDIPLTKRGAEEATRRAKELVGDGLAIDPKHISTVYISPRQRALTTFQILFGHLPELPHHDITEEVREWDYGDYEGLKPAEIQEKTPGWWIWRDGCPNGESVEEMQKRVDGVIEKVRAEHKAWLEKGEGARDVVVVAHGHFNRVLVARWINFDLSYGTHFNIEPASMSILAYNHRNLSEPAINALNR